MTILLVLVPLALTLGLIALVAFFWSLHTHQFEDLDGAGWRAISDDDISANDAGRKDAGRKD